jgi:glyoxylase-like metal-dependent hydrolase (beta-lactamase superfamily II)
MLVKTLKVGRLETNCYILENNNQTLIIDPGAQADKIKANIKYPITAILVTHKHSDHIGAIKDFDVPVYDIKNIDKFSDKSFEFEVIKTPGHTDDSITLYFEKEKTMFTGDFIFKGAYGRTDLGGNNTDMINSLDMISKYPKDTKIYPGQGGSTTLNNEINIFKLYKNMLKL